MPQVQSRQTLENANSLQAAKVEATAISVFPSLFPISAPTILKLHEVDYTMEQLFVNCMV